MNTIREIADWILSRDGFGIITHVSPDGDAFGSELALYGGLKKIGKRVCALCADPVTRYCSFLPSSGDVKDSADIEEYPYMITVDCADAARMGKLETLFNAAEDTACIDHHITNTGYARLNHVEEAAATGEIIYRLLCELGVMIDTDIATCIYTAIVTDTGNFAYNNTTAESFRIAAEMLLCSIDLSRLNRRLFTEVSYGRFLLQSRLTNNIRMSPDGTVAVSYLSGEDFRATGTLPEDGESMSEKLRDIVGVEGAAVLKQAENGSIRVSMRGKNYVDVSRVALKHAGGGHKFAAGCTLEGDIRKQADVIYEELCQAVKEHA